MTRKAAKPIDRESFSLVLRSLPADVPARIRLRRLLKILRRAFGFQCVDIRELTPADARVLASSSDLRDIEPAPTDSESVALDPSPQPQTPIDVPQPAPDRQIRAQPRSKPPSKPLRAANAPRSSPLEFEPLATAQPEPVCDRTEPQPPTFEPKAVCDTSPSVASDTTRRRTAT
jgi:hypothetical protein